MLPFSCSFYERYYNILASGIRTFASWSRAFVFHTHASVPSRDERPTQESTSPHEQFARVFLAQEQRSRRLQYVADLLPLSSCHCRCPRKTPMITGSLRAGSIHHCAASRYEYTSRWPPPPPALGSTPPESGESRAPRPS